MANSQIPFNRPPVGEKELSYLKEALFSGKISGDGGFTQKCHRWLETELKTKKSLLTHSCTAALEMSALLSALQPGDEVIMPSYTFVSTANAVVLRGAVPVFIDVREDTMNLDEKLIEAAITPKTKAIFPVHYAGVACEMDQICAIAEKHRLLVLEDAAQALGSKYKGRALGTIGHLGSLSFHDTKNVVSGEGGALLINDDRFKERAEIIREKGTNRSQFFRGQVDKYTWVDVGSSFLPSELNAAVLLAQLETSQEITKKRMDIWNQYHEGLATLESKGLVRRPFVPPGCEHNAHIYYVITRSLEERTKLADFMKQNGVAALFHYVPLHSAPAGRKYSRTHGSLQKTEELSDRLLRLPMWAGLTKEDAARVLELIEGFFQ